MMAFYQDYQVVWEVSTTPQSRVDVNVRAMDVYGRLSHEVLGNITIDNKAPVLTGT